MAWWSLILAMPVLADSKGDFARGVLEELRGNDGTEWFEQALEADPDAALLVGRVGERRTESGDIEGAATLYREFAGRHPGEVGPQVAYADFLAEVAPGDDFAAKLASEALEKALEISPGDVRVIRRLFRVYEQRGLRERSLKLFEKVRAGNVSGLAGSSSALVAADMARTIFSTDDKETRAKIDEVFELAMKRTPEDPVLARAASEHFRKSGRLPEAVTMLEKHAKAVPSSLALRVRLGVLLFAADRTDEGELVLKEVLRIDNRQGLAHQSLAKLYRRQEQPEEARPHAAEVLKIRGGDADEFVVLSEEFLAADMVRAARLLLEKGLYDHPEHPGIAVKLAVAVRRDPETRDGAVRYFREAESLSGTDGPATEPEFQREFAECLLEGGQTGAAEDRLRAAIKAYSAEEKAEMAAALRRLAEIWQSENRNDAAAKALLKRAEMLEK